VLSQIRALRDELGAGILEVIFQPLGRDKVLRSMDLFGRKVLPKMRDI